VSPLLEIEGLGRTFVVGAHRVRALDGVSLSVERGECHAIVGESGSGKSTLGHVVLGIIPPSEGSLRFNGVVLPDRRPRPLRRAIQLVQQNPLSALNPRRSVGASIRLPIDVHELCPRGDRDARVAELLKEVDLDPRFARRSPRGLSGGERQRIAIARALAAEPALIVLDEPTSALDVLVQARVLDLLARLRREHGLTYIFITHDLAVVRAIADRVSVFQRGRLVETGTVADIFAAPQSAYTRELIGAIPVVTEEEARLRDQIRSSPATTASAA
jgi:ABC-type glutathione transport system ATPase component